LKVIKAIIIIIVGPGSDILKPEYSTKASILTFCCGSALVLMPICQYCSIVKVMHTYASSSVTQIQLSWFILLFLLSYGPLAYSCMNPGIGPGWHGVSHRWPK